MKQDARFLDGEGYRSTKHSTGLIPCYPPTRSSHEGTKRSGTGGPIAWLATATAANPSDPLAAQANRRHDELISQGFNLPQRLTLSSSPVNRELLVPGSDGETVIALRFEATQGELAVQLTGPRGEVIASWRGRADECMIPRRAVTTAKSRARWFTASSPPLRPTYLLATPRPAAPRRRLT